MTGLLGAPLCLPLLSSPLCPDELVQEKEKYKAISDELDQTFSELTGY